jgi:RNA polymerase sigma-70 factor (ECF subfamily)
LRSTEQTAAVLQPDDALIERARQGDAAAYASLVERYQDVAFRTAYIVLRDAAEAEDAAQEGFIKAFYALSRFKAGKTFRPWLLEIVANQARNQRRASGRRGALALRANPNQTTQASPEADVVDKERSQTLLNALNRLRNDDRLMLAYRYFFELSESEMAVALGCARGTVKSRLSRALDRLRRTLPEWELRGG